jgi:enamine deaminase RidA (YjgF/YER057c/UK114 family)
MTGTINAHLTELAIKLPIASVPAGNYVPFIVTGNLLFVAGQMPFWNGELRHQGRLGDDFDIDTGYQAARTCGLNLIAQAQVACSGDLDRVVRVIKLGGFVNCTPDFTDLPKVVNGASDLMVEVFGASIGVHARVAIGAPSLPLGVAVEVDGVFEIN